jgi:hypothetical protein
MVRMSSRIRIFVIPLSFLLVFLVAACGGSDDGSTGSEAAAQPPATVAPAVENLTGLSIGEPIIEAGQYGGTVSVNVVNSSGELCSGFSVIYDLLSENGAVISNVGIVANGELLDGAEATYKDKYIGIGVSGTRMSAVSCDNSSASHGAPQSPTK